MSTLEATRDLFGVTRRPFVDGLRRLAAWTLMGASEVFRHVAGRLHPAPIQTRDGPRQLEFHAEVGTSDGALYLDGEWVARLPGVTRL